MKKTAPARKKNTAAAGQGPVRLWLIRHAHAVDATEDAVRPLSGRGRRQVRALARLLAASGAFQPQEIWHSPLVRARQTAELLVRRLALDLPAIETAGLTPDDAPRAVAQRLRTLGRNLAIVGHEPHLSALASLLVAGAAEPPVFVLKKCAVLALERVEGRWVVRWLVSPEVVA